MQTTCDELIRRTRCIQQIDTMTVVNAATALVGVPANFRPDRIVAAYLTGANVKVVWGFPTYGSWFDTYYSQGAPSYSDITAYNTTAILNPTDYLPLYNRVLGEHFSSQPSYIAFDSWAVGAATTGIVYPIPDDNYTIKLRWTPFFTAWMPGRVFTPVATATISGGLVTGITSTPGGAFTDAPTVTITGGGGTGATATAVLDPLHNTGTVSSYKITAPGTGYTSVPTVTVVGGSPDLLLNIPDDMIRSILMYGAPSLLQYNIPEQAFATEAFKRCEQYIISMMGAGSLGARTAVASRRY